jgi:Protein of unknown function (DUF2550)
MTRVEVDTGLILLVVVLAAALYIVVIAARKQQLLGRPGGIQLALRIGHEGWKLGVGRYAGDDLLWYGAWRPGRRPNRTLSRNALEISGQRGRRANEAILPEGYTVVECRDGDENISLCLSVGAVTGFLSWLEASAPRS